MNWQSIGHVDFMLRTLDLGVGLGLQRALLNRATITMTGVNDSADTANDATCAALSAFLASGSQSELLRIQACLAGDADLLVVEDPPKRGGSGSGRFAKLLKSYAATLPVMREKRDEVDVDGRGGGLTKRCGKVRQWRRFCAGARGGTPWPRCRTRVQAESDVGDDADDRFVSSSGYGVVVVRLQGGGNQEALRMTTAAVASVMPPGATLVVCGTRAEGVLGSATASTIESYFHGCRVASATRDLDGGGVVLLASRRCGLVMSSAGNGASGSLDTWARDQTLELPGPAPVDSIAAAAAAVADAVVSPSHTPTTTRQWRVYPGLFAGGGLDVMTTMLLQTLPLMSPANCPAAAGAFGGWARKVSCSSLGRQGTRNGCGDSKGPHLSAF